jgi:hypothetical protein
MQEVFAEAGDASLEFAREGYRLSLNPVAGRFDEVGFVLWQEEADGDLAPIAAGRAVGDEVILDGEPGSGRELADLEAVIASLLDSPWPATTGAGETGPAAAGG